MLLRRLAQCLSGTVDTKMNRQGPYQQGAYCLIGDVNTGDDAVHGGHGRSWHGAPGAQGRPVGDTR